MTLVRTIHNVQISLQKDLVRNIKRGHAWLFRGAIEMVDAPSGTVAELLDRRQEKLVATGMYDPKHTIPMRVCRTWPPFDLDDAWMDRCLKAACAHRKTFVGDDTTGFRLVAGEGDALPGIIIDCYADVAVLKLDGGAPEVFYDAQGVAEWLVENTHVNCVVQRFRERSRAAEVLVGKLSCNPVIFSEHGMQFTADVLNGQKTGFFLDQRENRGVIRSVSLGAKVLNLFSFSGGFSVAAGVGGAKSVTSVDAATPAIEAANMHWEQNGFPPEMHRGVVADCFEYLSEAASKNRQWDIVICDPPSFAPSEQARSAALVAYRKLAQLAAKVTRPGGLLAMSSCSSHVNRDAFEEVTYDGLGLARRSPVLVADRGLPADHPTPGAMPELRYLKFLLFRLS